MSVPLFHRYQRTYYTSCYVMLCRLTGEMASVTVLTDYKLEFSQTKELVLLEGCSHTWLYSCWIYSVVVRTKLL